MSQTTYQINTEAAVLGGLADSGEHDIVSARAAAVIEYGKGLTFEADGDAIKPSAAGQNFAGVAIQSDNQSVSNAGVAEYAADDAVPVLRKGRVWVYSEQAVNPTLAVFLRHTLNVTLVPGDFRVDIDTANAIDISAFARWVSTTTAAGMAIVEINAP